MSDKIKTYDDINKMFNTNYRPKPFTSFEMKIFNSNFNDEDFDLNNKEIINSLSNYYDIYNDIEKHLLYVERLVELNDSRGHLKLGNHYVKFDKTLSFSHFKKAAEMGNVLAMSNLGYYYSNEGEYFNYDLAKKYYEQAILHRFTPAIIQLANLYLISDQIVECYQCIQLGVKNGCELSFDVLAAYFTTKTELYIYLTNLNYSNDLIKRHIKEIEPLIDQKTVDCERGTSTILKIKNTLLEVDKFGDLVILAEGELTDQIVDIIGICNDK